MLIGLSGKRGVGKTLGASYLVNEHGFTKLSLADDLKVIAKILFPFSDNDLRIPSKKEAKFKEYDWTPRDFMIHLGEFMRFHDANYWLNKTTKRCEDTKIDYVIDDIRFKNEAQAIKDRGGKIIRINRYEKLNIYGKNLDTPSETDLDSWPFDFVIHEIRNTSQMELFRQLESFLELE